VGFSVERGSRCPPTRLEPNLPRRQARREGLARTRMKAAGKESGGRPTRPLAVGERRGEAGDGGRKRVE
jgi:hypothetical protein